MVNFGVLGVMRNVRSDRIGRAMFCEWYGFSFLSDILSREQHMLYADSSPVSGGTVLIKTTRNNCVKNGQRLFKDGRILILLSKNRLKIFCPSKDVRHFIAYFFFQLKSFQS